MSSMSRDDLLAVSLVLSNALDVLNLLTDGETGETSNNIYEAACKVADAISFIQEEMTQLPRQHKGG